jgi:hypothetical protein
MSFEQINIGNTANDTSGDPLRVAFQKINNNFATLASISSSGLGAGPAGAVQYNESTVTATAHAVMSTVNTGTLASIVVDLAGTGYSEPPTVTITRATGDITGVGAAAQVTSMSDTGVATIGITNFGSYYTQPPIITISAPTASSRLAGSANLVYDAPTNTLSIGANIIPTGNLTIDIGSPTKQIANLWLGPNALHIGNSTASYANGTITFTETNNPAKLTNIVAGNITGNTVTANNFNIGNLTTSGAFTFTTSSNVANQVIYTVLDCAFKTGKFEIYSEEVGTPNMQSVTVTGSKAPDDSTIKYNAYSTLFNGNILVNSYDMDIDGCNINLMVSPSSATIKHTVTYTEIK